MNNPKIEIKTDGSISQIYVDGKKLDGVRSYKLEQTVNGIPILTLDLNAFDVSVDGQMLTIQKGVGEIELSIKG